jgi:predicted nuclease of restriction endonuclease-like (RecB) superfamily
LLVRKARSPEALTFYHTEAVRGGWSVRQLDRQIASQFYECTALSKNKAAMLTRGAEAKPGDALSADDEVRDPLVLEFLGLKDEYSENDLEAALVRHLEAFLLELGGDFAFIGRQRRLRSGDEWYLSAPNSSTPAAPIACVAFGGTARGSFSGRRRWAPISLRAASTP